MATGDGEDILRVCLSHLVVELMRTGKTPQQACSEGIARLIEMIDDDHTAELEQQQQQQSRMHRRLTVSSCCP